MDLYIKTWMIEFQTEGHSTPLFCLLQLLFILRSLSSTEHPVIVLLVSPQFD